MKVIFALFVLGLCYYATAEIVPRFPGNQPLRFQSLQSVPVNADNYLIKFIIDPFSVNTIPTLVAALQTAAPPSISAFTTDFAFDVIGRERDILITVEEGPAGSNFQAGVIAEEFIIDMPTGRGVVELQYDGLDNSPNVGTLVGLGGINLLADDALGFVVIAQGNVATEFTISLFDGNRVQASSIGSVPAGRPLQPYFIPFSSFPNIDLSNINAIVFRVQTVGNVEFVVQTFATYGTEEIENCLTSSVLPCDTDFYRLETLTDVQPGDYMVVEFVERGRPKGANLYVKSSDFQDLQAELASNENVIDTLGELPGPNNYDYVCTQDCIIEIVFSALRNTTYYFGIEGANNATTFYQLCLYRRSVPVTELRSNVALPVFLSQRPTIPPDDRVLHYAYYYIDIPIFSFSEGTYLVVNISRAVPLPGVDLQLMYQSLPEFANDTGVLENIDLDSDGNRVDGKIYQWCVDTRAEVDGFPSYDNPAYWHPRKPCHCFTQVERFGNGPAFQLSCSLTVDPCRFRYGRWFASVKLPERQFPDRVNDTTGRTNYTLTAFVIQPSITQLQFRNVTYKGFAEPESMTHYKLNIPAQEVGSDTHLMVHVSNIRNGFVDIWVHRGIGGNLNLAGGPEGCAPANITCRTCDACNLIVEKCHFTPGTWYISVSVAFDENGEFLLFDEARLPITYTIRANWVQDSVERLVAGVPVSKFIGEALYDFYELTVPRAIDTWLIVELFANANDTEVVLSVLHGELPGGECYARPDFYCMTGDPYGKLWSTGTPTFYENEAVQRESCSFMIQPCELQPGPLFFSVYGHHTGYATYGDNTFYEIPVHYTLWVDFETALPLLNSISYTETVVERQYQHYYLRADQVAEGSWLSVEVTNVRNIIPQSVEVFVNYNLLAGNCPCYDHLFNCTGSNECENSDSSVINEEGKRTMYTTNPYGNTVVRCCTIIVPASDFRPGIWYVSVLGVNEDHFQYTAPIGYTLTVTIHDPPTFIPLLLGQTATAEVPQWNRTLEYTHFKLAASPIPLNDLIIKVTWVQNCEYLGKHDDRGARTDTLKMFVNKKSPAGETLSGHDYWCRVNVFTDSYCTIVVPHCEWEVNDRIFIAIKGDFEAIFKGRITLKAFTDELRDIELTDGVPFYNRISENRYTHYFISTTAESDQFLHIEIYTNQDHDAITAYLNKDQKAGDDPCFTHTRVCVTTSCCSWQILACDMEPGRYYVSIKGASKQFYDTSSEYTIIATHKPVALQLTALSPVTSHLISVGDIHHYFVEINNAGSGTWLLFTVDRVKHGAVTVFSEYGSLAGRCPCFTWEQTCSASSIQSDLQPEWCSIRIPACELQNGKYFFSVIATATSSPNPPIFKTPIGYIVEVEIITARITTPFFNIGRDINDASSFEFVANDRYRHFRLVFSKEDFKAGYHIVTEISSIFDGSLRVFYNQIEAGDEFNTCHSAQICTNGAATDYDCRWQLPYCLTKPSIDNRNNEHFISILGTTHRDTQASFSILFWKQDFPTIVENPSFSLNNSTIFPPNTELNTTHSKFNEPNGWTRFVKLSNVDHPDSGNGDLLELFFYRITNNVGEPTSFSVYVHPNRPAGAHGCCENTPQQLGSCQNAPCLTTADTTTQVNFGPEHFSHVCDLGEGTGRNGPVNDPFFGGRCTVRVWPCEFNKYCDNVTDWFVSIVPNFEPSRSSEGPGLQYSLQWRTRNIRRSSDLSIGTTDISAAINSFDLTTEFLVPWSSIDEEGWRSFSITGNFLNSRLSIQTLFSASSGIVYINGKDFASPTETCNIYHCSASSSVDCFLEGRFIVSECCDDKYETYFITVRNTATVPLTVQFRIVATPINPVIDIPLNPTEASPYVTNSQSSLFGVQGVFGESYDFYRFTIRAADLFDYHSWVINVQQNLGSDQNLQVFIRYGAEPGNYGVSSLQAFYGNNPEGCHAWQYSCSLSPGSTCTFQIPHCDLIPGFWFIGIWNPNFNPSGSSLNLPDYTLSTYISRPVFFPLNSVVSSDRFMAIGLLNHYSFNVSVDSLGFDDRRDLSGYWTRWLRLGVTSISEGSVTMWVNYDDLAGPPSRGSCLDSFQSVECLASTGCFVDVTPCEISGSDFKLKTGTYFISVLTEVQTSWEVFAVVLENDYTPIPMTATVLGAPHRAGTQDQVWSYTATQPELSVNGDGDGNYRYVIDVTGIDGDDIDSNEYFIVNITTSAMNAQGNINLEVWRDDCTRFSCELSGFSFCTIDALTLAPCSAKAGRFYFRVENPAALNFTLTFYRNQTNVQDLLRGQTITEIIYPYEYQQYFYEPIEILEAATLEIRICSFCGDVQAWIRRDLPAGPSPDVTGYLPSCSMDSCIATGPDKLTFNEEVDNCCSLFLDTCQFEQRGYYIGVRGVSTVFPAVNENLYLPAKYQIQAIETILNFTDISFSQCMKSVDYLASWNDIPRQYAIDIESINVGTSLRFSLRLPNRFANANNQLATIWTVPNAPVGYTDSCPKDIDHSCSTTTTCSFVIPYCQLQSYSAIRYYIWADAPRGSEILVERWDPSIPIIEPNIRYHATINGPDPNVDFNSPYTPNLQIYRFSFDPEHDKNYYEKFFVRIKFSTTHGTVAAQLNSGNFPFLPDTGCQNPTIVGSCITNDGDCFIQLEYNSDEEIPPPTTFWLSVRGLEQQCELHSIQYDFIIQSNWVLTYFPIAETICNSVEVGEYNFHRLRPREAENPQTSLLSISITDLNPTDSVRFFLRDNFIATESTSAVFSPTDGSIDAIWYCGYKDLYLSVYGQESVDDDEIPYRMRIDKLPIRPKLLFDDSTYHADDDDDDACPHPADFYMFRTAKPRGHHKGSFLRVAVDSEFHTQVYINKNSVAWSPCHDSGYGENRPEETQTTTVNVYDFCNFQDGTYYITVVSDGPYYIYTDIRDDTKPLTLGEAFVDVLEPGMYQMYSLKICEEWFNPDDRLIIELADVQNGNVEASIRFEANPGIATSDDTSTFCGFDRAFARYGPGESGYDFLLVNHCDLQVGTYYILVRADPPPGSPERNCKHVSYRLFPYLTDYEIDPVPIRANLPIRDAVDFYTINRIDPTSTQRINYYSLTLLMEDEGYCEQVSHAVARLYDVEGGLLRLLVACDHLAIPENAFIGGDIRALTKMSELQSGTRPFTYQQVLDPRQSALQSECDGCSDFCCEMSFDEPENLIRDKSCAIWLPSCYLIWAHFYLAVEPIEQFAEDHSVSYSLMVHQTRDFMLLQPDTNQVSSFTDNNWDYRFYYSISAEPQSMRWRVVVTQGEGVLVTVRNDRCPLKATWEKEIWCDADYFNRPWMCDIEIPTRVSHPGDNAYFLSVYGKNATYSIAFWRGRENCHEFSVKQGRPDGLDFCAGLIPYATWRWDNFQNLDREAECFFESLYEHFRVQPCWSGVTPECNSTLQAFACFESFHSCDQQGFAVGTCKSSCDAVVYSCFNWFESVDLEHYNCTSSRYIDDAIGTCSGNNDFVRFDDSTQLFLGDPEDILFKSSPSTSSSTKLTASCTILVTLFLLCLL